MNAPFKLEKAHRPTLEFALAQIATIARTAIGEVPPQAVTPVAPGAKSLLERARAFYAARRRRDRIFGNQADLLFDPVWDMLLELFIAHHDGRSVSVTSVCGAACAAPTTALRWLTSLEGRGLVQRAPDHKDRRRHFVELSPAGIALMSKALAER